MTAFWPGVTGIDDKGFGGSRGGDPINGVVIHHTANGGGLSALGYVANANSRNSHPTYLVQNGGQVFGIVHPDRRPYSTAGRPDTEAVSFEVDNESGAPNWGISDKAIEAVAQVIAYHYKASARFGNGIARNIKGVAQKEFFVAWHSQYVATACPGPDMISKLDRIIARALQIAHPTTPPVDPNTKVEVGKVVGVKAAFGAYSSSKLARAAGTPAATYPAGNYTVYKIDGDCVNLTRTPGKAGGWAVTAKLGLVTPLPVFNVVFDDTPNDPNSIYAKVAVTQGELVKKPATDPVLAGSTFLGWFDLDGSSTVAYDFSKPVTAGLTLVAKFEAIPTPGLDPDVVDFLDGLKKSIDDFLDK